MNEKFDNNFCYVIVKRPCRNNNHCNFPPEMRFENDYEQFEDNYQEFDNREEFDWRDDRKCRCSCNQHNDRHENKNNCRHNNNRRCCFFNFFRCC